MASVKDMSVNDVLNMDVGQLHKACTELGIVYGTDARKPELQTALIDFCLRVTKPEVKRVDVNYEFKLKELEFAERAKEREYERERVVAEHERERVIAERESVERDKQREFERERMKYELKMKSADSGVKVENDDDKLKVQSAARLLPCFTESNVENYFCVFERIAKSNAWPEDMWAAVLQPKLCGKALKAFSELDEVKVTDYELLKEAILVAYELVPEVYRKRFRSFSKRTSETYTDFAHTLKIQFKRWLSGMNAYDDVEKLRQALLIEQFTQTLPTELRLWLLEKEPETLDEAAKLADQYSVTHKLYRNVSNVYTDKTVSDTRPSAGAQSNVAFKPSATQPRWNSSFERSCLYCHQKGHVIANCTVRKRNEERRHSSNHVNLVTGDVAVGVNNTGDTRKVCDVNKLRDTDDLLRPYCHIAWLMSVTGEEKPIVVLRDTGATRSLLSACHVNDVVVLAESVNVKGITSGYVSVPLVKTELRSEMLRGSYTVGLSDNLPIAIDMLLGNDIVCGDEQVVGVVQTRAQSRLTAGDRPTVKPMVDTVVKPVVLNNVGDEYVDMSEDFNVLYKPDIDVNNITRNELVDLQRQDVTLTKLYEGAIHVTDEGELNEDRVEYYLHNGVLFRKWRNRDDITDGCFIKQIVVPVQLRAKVLHMAHDRSFAGHLGVKKTLDRLLQNFFWPKVFAEVKEYCKTCSTCQLIGKSTEKHKAPLVLPPIIGVPFRRVSIDIVGPLPRTSSGCRFILTVMDHASRWPEAFALVDHTAASVADKMMEYFARYGFCSEVLSDRGSDFMSELFQCFTYKLGVQQIRCTPAHPQTNGMIEKFHACLKRVLKTYVKDYEGDWDKILCYALFAYREVPVVSLGLSPFEIVFGKHVKGPMSLLFDEWLSEIDVTRKSSVNIVQYMENLRERLQNAMLVVHDSLTDAQEDEKTYYDKDARSRVYEVGQKVLVMLPVPGDALSVKYQGPYTVERQTSPVDYVIRMPSTRRVLRVVHVNMMRPYFNRSQYVSLVVSDRPTVQCREVAMNVEDDLDLGDIPSSLSGVDRVQSGVSCTADKLHDKLKHLNQSQRSDMFNLLCRHKGVFSEKPGKTNLMTHSIKLKADVQPVQLRPYRMNVRMQEILRGEIEQMLKDGLIVESESEWSSPVLMVPKPDTTVRTCVDYRKVNDLSVVGNFPMPRVEDLVDKVGKAQFLTKIDLTKGFWQIPLDEKSRDIAAFVTPFGRYSWNFMPFGLKGSPSTFERCMCKALKGYEDFVGIYLDDILIFSMCWSDHVKHVGVVLSRLSECGFTLKLNKCEFAKNEIDYVGHRIGKGLVKPLEAKVKSLINFPRPTNKKQVLSFLGLAGYYQKFIAHYSDIAAPLSNLLCKSNSFVWSTECECSFQMLKSKLSSHPVLIVPDFEKSFAIFVDCSDVAIGACLAQLNCDNIYMPVCYLSRKLNVHQKHYATSEKEALALLTAVRSFKIYLFKKFVVFTDHSPLTFLKRMSSVNQKLLRWVLELEQYDMEIVHVKGVDNVIADCLSRPAS